MTVPHAVAVGSATRPAGVAPRPAPPGAAPPPGRALRAGAERTRRTRLRNGSVLAAAAALGVLLTLLHDALPDRFAYDESKIQRIAQGYAAFPEDKAFQTTGDLYRLLGLADAPLLAGLLGMAGLGLCTALALRGPAHPGASALRTVPLVLAAGTLVLGGLYLGQYSKEALLLPVVALALVRGRRVEPAFLVAVLAYGAFLRTYWLLVLVLYVVLRLALARRAGWWALGGTAVVAYVALAVGFVAWDGLALDHFRTAVNAVRADGVDAATMIRPLLPGDGVAVGVVNCLAVLVSFAVPVPLLALAAPQHLAAAAFQALLWWSVLAAAHRRIVPARHGSPGRDGPHDPAAARALALLLAFVLVQALFEPDYGSALRHLTPLLPLALLVVRTPSSRATGPAWAP
ncbi:hypothetical protein [Puerhibacterium sp. TATVAM-FAB25]|uniref:hypothetical protein n=1 Tax=Puerhibacterium sp. TATVAM-FAB25 TaxID=3093699 RepID=UPI00397A17DE